MRRECALGAIVARAEVRFGIDGIAGWWRWRWDGWMAGWWGIGRMC